MANAFKLLITLRRAPHGSIYVQEAIEVMFIMATFDMDLSIVFLDDGVYALKQGQDTHEMNIKGFSASLGALVDWDVNNVFVDEQSLTERNISADQLISIGEAEDTEETVYPKIISSEQLREMMHSQDAVMSL